MARYKKSAAKSLLAISARPFKYIKMIQISVQMGQISGLLPPGLDNIWGKNFYGSGI
jgi:hypothetical protein